MQSFSTSLSGMQAGLKWLDEVGNNIANENTPGFAENTNTFEDALTSAVTANATAPTMAGRFTPPGWRGGTGVIASPTENSFAQMQTETTGNPTDMAISGPAFFLIRDAAGKVALTKAGNFQWSKSASGRFELTTPAGDAVLDTAGQPIYAPAGTPEKFSVAPDGTVTFGGGSSTATGGASGGTTGGQRIAIAEIPLPSVSLIADSNNLFTIKAGYTPRVINAPGAGNGAGTGSGGATSATSTIQQGVLSMSNVDMTVQMTDMLEAQQMFSLNEEALQLTNRMQESADTMHG